MKNIDVVIITLNYDQNEYTLKCIDSLLKIDNESFKILVIDNGSTQENYDDLKKSVMSTNLIDLLRIEINCGYVGGINYGLSKGALFKPNYFLILNNDTIIDKDALKHLIFACSLYQEKAIVSGKVYHYDDPTILQDIGYKYLDERNLKFKRLGYNEEDIGKFDSIQERDLLDDVFWLFPAELYKMIGGYCEDFWFNAEQADFAIRAKKKGYKLIYSPEAKLWHKGSISIGGRNENPRLAYWNIQSTLIFRFKHLKIRYFIIQYLILLISILGSFCRIIWNKIIGKKTNFIYTYAKLMGLMYFNKWIFKRNFNNGYNPFS